MTGVNVLVNQGLCADVRKVMWQPSQGGSHSPQSLFAHSLLGKAPLAELVLTLLVPLTPLPLYMGLLFSEIKDQIIFVTFNMPQSYSAINASRTK